MKAIIFALFLVGLLLMNQASAESSEDFLEDFDFSTSAQETKVPSSNYVPSYTYESTTIYPTYELIGSNGNLTSRGAHPIQTEDSVLEDKGPSGIQDKVRQIIATVIEMQKSITSNLKKWVEDYTGANALAIAKFSRARLYCTRAITKLEKSSAEDKILKRAVLIFQQEFEVVKDDFSERTAEKGANPVKYTKKIDQLIKEAIKEVKPDPPINGREEEDDCC